MQKTRIVHLISKCTLFLHGAMMTDKKAMLFLLRWIVWGLRRCSLLTWWLLFDFSGIRFICKKIRPPLPGNTKRPAASAFLWFIGIYFAAFGVASQRYENAIDRIEARSNGIYAQAGAGRYLQAIERIPDAQHMTRPQKPILTSPLSIYRSLFGHQVCDAESSDCLKEFVVSFKNELRGVNLRLVPFPPR